MVAVDVFAQKMTPTKRILGQFFEAFDKPSTSTVKRLEYLIKLGEIDQQDILGTDLHKEAISGSRKSVKRILQTDIHVDYPNNFGQSPLYCACARDNEATAIVLLKYGANPNEKCHDGCTPVHIACYVGNVHTLGKLIEAGGDLRLHDNSGNSVRDWAVRNPDKKRRMRMVEFLDRMHLCALSYCGETISNARALNFAGYCRRSGNTSLLELMRANTGSDGALDRSHSVHSSGFGKVYMGGRGCSGIVSVIPLISETVLFASGEAPFDTGFHTFMEQMDWTNTPVSVKQVKPGLNMEDGIDLLITEAEYLGKLRHPHILLLMAISQPSSLDSMMLVFERVADHTLHHWLYTQGKLLDKDTLMMIVKQVSAAMEFIHSQSLIHCGLSSMAIYLVSPKHFKVGNFEYMVEAVKADIGKVSPVSTVSHRGLLYNWMAPELMEGLAPHFSSDVYSFCAIVWEVFAGQIPWTDHSPEDIYKLVVERETSININSSHLPTKLKAILDYGLVLKEVDRLHSFAYITKWLSSTQPQPPENTREPTWFNSWAQNRSSNALDDQWSREPTWFNSWAQNRSSNALDDQSSTSLTSSSSGGTVQQEWTQDKLCFERSSSWSGLATSTSPNGCDHQCIKTKEPKYLSSSTVADMAKLSKNLNLYTQKESPKVCERVANMAIKPASHVQSPSRHSIVADNPRLLYPTYAQSKNMEETHNISRDNKLSKPAEDIPSPSVKQLTRSFQQQQQEHNLRQAILKGSMAPKGKCSDMDISLDSPIKRNGAASTNVPSSPSSESSNTNLPACPGPAKTFPRSPVLTRCKPRVLCDVGVGAGAIEACMEGRGQLAKFPQVKIRERSETEPMEKHNLACGCEDVLTELKAVCGRRRSQALEANADVPGTYYHSPTVKVHSARKKFFQALEGSLVEEQDVILGQDTEKEKDKASSPQVVPVVDFQGIGSSTPNDDIEKEKDKTSSPQAVVDFQGIGNSTPNNDSFWDVGPDSVCKHESIVEDGGVSFARKDCVIDNGLVVRETGTEATGQMDDKATDQEKGIPCTVIGQNDITYELIGQDKDIPCDAIDQDKDIPCDVIGQDKDIPCDVIGQDKDIPCDVIGQDKDIAGDAIGQDKDIPCEGEITLNETFTIQTSIPEQSQPKPVTAVKDSELSSPVSESEGVGKWVDYKLQMIQYRLQSCNSKHDEPSDTSSISLVEIRNISPSPPVTASCRDVNCVEKSSAPPLSATEGDHGMAIKAAKSVEEADGCEFEFEEFYIDDDIDSSERLQPDMQVLDCNISTRRGVNRDKAQNKMSVKQRALLFFNWNPSKKPPCYPKQAKLLRCNIASPRSNMCQSATILDSSVDDIESDLTVLSVKRDQVDGAMSANDNTISKSPNSVKARVTKMEKNPPKICQPNRLLRSRTDHKNDPCTTRSLEAGKPSGNMKVQSDPCFALRVDADAGAASKQALSKSTQFSQQKEGEEDDTSKQLGNDKDLNKPLLVDKDTVDASLADLRKLKADQASRTPPIIQTNSEESGQSMKATTYSRGTTSTSLLSSADHHKGTAWHKNQEGFSERDSVMMKKRCRPKVTSCMEERYSSCTSVHPPLSVTSADQTTEETKGSMVSTLRSVSKLQSNSLQRPKARKVKRDSSSDSDSLSSDTWVKAKLKKIRAKINRRRSREYYIASSDEESKSKEQTIGTYYDYEKILASSSLSFSDGEPALPIASSDIVDPWKHNGEIDEGEEENDSSEKDKHDFETKQYKILQTTTKLNKQKSVSCTPAHRRYGNVEEQMQERNQLRQPRGPSVRRFVEKKPSHSQRYEDLNHTRLKNSHSQVEQDAPSMATELGARQVSNEESSPKCEKVETPRNQMNRSTKRVISFADMMDGEDENKDSGKRNNGAFTKQKPTPYPRTKCLNDTPNMPKTSTTDEEKNVQSWLDKQAFYQPRKIISDDSHKRQSKYERGPDNNVPQWERNLSEDRHKRCNKTDANSTPNIPTCSGVKNHLVSSTPVTQDFATPKTHKSKSSRLTKMERPLKESGHVKDKVPHRPGRFDHPSMATAQGECCIGVRFASDSEDRSNPAYGAHKFYIPWDRWSDGCTTRLKVAVDPDDPMTHRVTGVTRNPRNGLEEVFLKQTLHTQHLKTFLHLD